MSRIKILKLVGSYIIADCESINILVKLNEIIFVGICYGCFIIAVCGCDYSFIFGFCFCNFRKKIFGFGAKLFKICSFICRDVVCIGQSLDILNELADCRSVA